MAEWANKPMCTIIKITCTESKREKKNVKFLEEITSSLWWFSSCWWWLMFTVQKTTQYQHTEGHFDLIRSMLFCWQFTENVIGKIIILCGFTIFTRRHRMWMMKKSKRTRNSLGRRKKAPVKMKNFVHSFICLYRKVRVKLLVYVKHNWTSS